MEALGKALYLVGLVLLLGLAGYINGIVGVTAMVVFFICYRMIAEDDSCCVYYPFEMSFMSDFEVHALRLLSTWAGLAIIVGTLPLLTFSFGEVASPSFWIARRDGVMTPGEFVSALFACAALLLIAIRVLYSPVTAHILACVILLAFGLSVGGLLGAAVSVVIVGGFYVARMVIEARERARMESFRSLAPSFTARPDEPRASGARMAG